MCERSRRSTPASTDLLSVGVRPRLIALRSTHRPLAEHTDLDTQRRRPETEPLHWLGVSYTTILGGENTGGNLSIVDSISPDGSGPPRHIHHREDEAFVVLSVQCEFWIAGETFVRGPGESAFVPRGTEHTFRIVGGAPCRHLLVLTPGGFEGFFADMARGQFRIPEDMPSIEESAARFQLAITGPPLGSG